MSIVKINLSGHDNQALTDLGFKYVGALHVDLTDADLCQKVAKFLAPLVGSGDTVTVALPGLAPLAAIVLTTIHGLSGQFASIQPLVRQQDGTFVPGPVTDLQAFRNTVARGNHRQDVVVL